MPRQKASLALSRSAPALRRIERRFLPFLGYQCSRHSERGALLARICRQRDGGGMNEMDLQVSALMLETASGKQTKSDLLGAGRYEFVPRQIGVVG